MVQHALEIPFPHHPTERSSAMIEPPWVSVEPRWEYKEVVCDLATEAPPSEDDLNALGEQGWELAGIVREDQRAYFYFKRERSGRTRSD